MWSAGIIRNLQVFGFYCPRALELQRSCFCLLILSMWVLRPSQCLWTGGEPLLSKCSSSFVCNLLEATRCGSSGRHLPPDPPRHGMAGGLGHRSHAAADFLEAVSNSILAEINEGLWKARLAASAPPCGSSAVTRTGEYMLTPF